MEKENKGNKKKTNKKVDKVEGSMNGKYTLTIVEVCAVLQIINLRFLLF